MTYIKQVSPNWVKIREASQRDDWSGFPDLSQLVTTALNCSLANLHLKYPFKQGFPQTPYDLDIARFYLIIPKEDWVGLDLREAVVDYSTQYMTEGLCWRLTTRTSEYRVGEKVDRFLVIAWAEK